MDSWPAQLQQKLNADSFQVDFGDTTVKSDMDVGPPKRRSRYTDAVDAYSASIDLYLSDYQVLEDFYKTTLGNGVLPFLLLNPMTNTTEAFKFDSPPSIRPKGSGGLVFTVTFKLERQPG